MLAGAIGALVLAMLEADHFWIANTVYLAFVLAAVVSSAVKIVLASDRAGFITGERLAVNGGHHLG